MTRPFLTAEWRNVVGVTYAVDADRLAPHVPPGVEIDELEGSPRVSLVAFAFSRTRVGGLAIPGHVRFPEINLRFYVRHRGERGVVFIREFVPKLAIAAVARALYNEPYRRVPMRCGAEPGADGLRIWHRFGAGLRSSLQITAAGTPATPAEDSAAYWLTHHDLGLGRSHTGATLRYLVEHPLWALYAPQDLRLDVDFAALYGPQWGWLRDATPSHLSIAAGSAVAVYPPRAG